MTAAVSPRDVAKRSQTEKLARSVKVGLFSQTEKLARSVISEGTDLNRVDRQIRFIHCLKPRKRTGILMMSVLISMTYVKSWTY